MQAESSYDQRPRVVHLDLKGLPPTDDRLVGLLDVFVEAGFNSILVEWEDMFPWTVDERFRSSTVYSDDTVRRFVERAAELDLELIPLVQCLGHMETPLQVFDDPGLREQPDRCDVLNVLAAGARQLVEAMIDDVLRLMPGVRYLHLGGDEAWSFATHPDTRAYARRHGKAQLYYQHVEPILDKLANSNIRPLLWHDMMIDWPDDSLKTLADKADVVVWGYVGHPDEVDHHFNARYIERFHKLGVMLWAAGAYKGADAMSGDLPDLGARVLNTRAWMDLNERFAFQGLIATAWSRYSTHRVQNEPIDAALDAMMAVGHLFKFGSTPEHPAALLCEIGEYDRWKRCHQAMSDITALRDAAWLESRQFQENAFLIGMTPQRPDSGILKHNLDNLHKYIEQLTEASAVASTAFRGLVADRWLDEYKHVRLQPLRDEYTRLQRFCTSTSTHISLVQPV